jgi:RNA polymerase sigma-70 factor (ECF subfamily)
MNQQLIDDSFSDTVKEELVRRLYEEIQKLPERRRQIMLLSIDGKSGKEIAEMLNISVNTVKAVKAKAMDSLRKATKDNPILFFL